MELGRSPRPEAEGVSGSRPASLPGIARQGRRLRAAIVLAGLVAAAAHPVAVYALRGSFDALVLAVDAAILVVALAAALWRVGGLIRERQSHAVVTLLPEVTGEPRDIKRTAAESLRTLIAHGVADAGLVALAVEQEPSDPEHSAQPSADALMLPLAASGYPAAWLERAAALPLPPSGAAPPIVSHDGTPQVWVRPLYEALGERPWVARVTLSSGGDPIGLLLLAGRRPGLLREGSLLATLGAQLSRALDHAALYEASYARERDLEQQGVRRREFMAAISHEIRTPLTSIQAFAELLQLDRESLDEGAEQLVNSLSHGVERLGALVNDLLDLGRVEQSQMRAEPSAVDVNETLRSAESVLRPAFMLREQSLDLDLTEEPLVAMVDMRHLEQIVLNLLSNANRHTPARGKVAVRARPAPDEWVRIEVQDSGPGIAPEDRTRIFEPYYRVQRAGAPSVPGSGLGLAVAQRLVRLQGGRIWVDGADDQNGSGARFCVELHAAMPFPG